MNPEDNDDIEMMSDADDDAGDVHQEPTTSIIDLVVDGKATEAKDAIYKALYQRVGERIDSMRPDINAAEIPNSLETETPEDSAEIDQEVEQE